MTGVRPYSEGRLRNFGGIRAFLRPLLALCSIAILPATSLSAQTGANVLVVTNAADADSIRIGDYYASHRGVPATQVLALQRLPVKPPDAIERAAFDATIQQPIANWLSANDAQDRIHYIVLTRGIPLRISGFVGTIGHRRQRGLGTQPALPAHDRSHVPSPARSRTHISWARNRSRRRCPSHTREFLSIW